MLHYINDILWNKILVFFLLWFGIYFTFRLNFVQFTKIHCAFKREKTSHSTQTISPIKTLITAVSAQVGVGNIAGASTAIALGGASSIFYMWLSGFFSMATAYLEGYFSIKYRKITKNSIIGGPNYYIKTAFKGDLGKLFATFFSILVIITMGFIGSLVQSNTLSIAINNAFSINKLLIGILTSILCFIIFRGGILRISSILEKFSPFVAMLYIICCILVIIEHRQNIPNAINEIFKGAFDFKAIGGGFFGIFTKEALRYGMSRGLFSNEAGLGSSPHIYALSSVKNPEKQGSLAMICVFIDTFIILTLTSLAILSAKPYINSENLAGITLTSKAFGTYFENSFSIIAMFIFYFALSSILGWYFYGEANTRLLFGEKYIKTYQILVVIFIFLGSIISLDFVWQLSDLFTGFLVIPNILSLFILSFRIKKRHNF